MADIKPIETRYKGCRFRSRLEARWAVFFDTLKIKWVYKPQGFEVDSPSGKVRYLPDFYLSSVSDPAEYLPGVFVEVKGSDEQLDRSKLGAVLSARGELRNLLLLGDIPCPGPNEIVGHSFLLPAPKEIGGIGCRQVKFTPSLQWLDIDPFYEYEYESGEIPESVSCNYTSVQFQVKRGIEIVPWGTDKSVIQAYKAARAARFEFGEQG